MTPKGTFSNRGTRSTQHPKNRIELVNYMPLWFLLIFTFLHNLLFSIVILYCIIVLNGITNFYYYQANIMNKNTKI